MLREKMTWAELRKKIPPLPERVEACGQVVLSVTDDDGRDQRHVTLLMHTLDDRALTAEAETFHWLTCIRAANDNSPD